MLARAASGVNHDILLALLRQTVTSPNALACFNDLVDMFKILDSKEAILVSTMSIVCYKIIVRSVIKPRLDVEINIF